MYKPSITNRYQVPGTVSGSSIQSLTLKFKGKKVTQKRGEKGSKRWRGERYTFMFFSKLTHLIEKSFWELLEALSTHKTLLMVQLAITVYDLLSGCKTPLAALTGSIGKGIGHVTVTNKGREVTD